MTPKRPTRLAAELAELAEESKIDNTQPSIQKVEHRYVFCSSKIACYPIEINAKRACGSLEAD